MCFMSIYIKNKSIHDFEINIISIYMHDTLYTVYISKSMLFLYLMLIYVLILLT